MTGRKMLSVISHLKAAGTIRLEKHDDIRRISLQKRWRRVLGRGQKRMTESPLIAIVDDDVVFRGALENLVRSLGWRACTFASAEAYLRSGLIDKTNCLIADVQMPNVNGLELRERLSDLGFNIPTVFITAYPDDTVKIRALSAGAVCFLHKPLDLQGRRLAECVEEALNRKGGQLQP